MTINERVRYFRKEILKMNQRAFAKCLGMKQTSISNLENVSVSEPAIRSMCLAFNLNEDWLRYGTEPMYLEESTFSLDAFIKENHATDLELEILKAYFELDPDLRKAVVNHFKDRLLRTDNKDDLFDSVPDTPEELEAKFPPVEDSNSEVS